MIKSDGSGMIMHYQSIAAMHRSNCHLERRFKRTIYGLTMKIALAWISNKDYVSSILVGASKISQLDDNLAAANLSLTSKELEKLDQATAPKPDFTVGVIRVPDSAIVSALSAKPGTKSDVKAEQEI
jgi:hypothetical protein